jgi:adenylate cyclase
VCTGGFVAFTRWQVLFDPLLAIAGNALVLVVLLTAGFAAAERQRRQLRLVFDKYMASEVVDEIMRHAENIHLGGTTQELSVFFSDVADFTTISEQFAPEALVEVLNMYLSTMAEVILRHRGNVNKYLGDGIMALFGTPRGDPNHATLACYAALDCQQALVHWQQAWPARRFLELTTRIGINSGPLVVGNMGSQARMEYTAMGDSVNLASRLEGANKFYGTRILIGPHTYELARNDIEAREVDVIRVKGKQEAVVIYELLERKGALSPQKRQLVEVFLAGLAAYKQRDFATAKCRFEAALCLDATDSPSQEYCRRSQEFLESPPPPDWDGVYEPPSK